MYIMEFYSDIVEHGGVIMEYSSLHCRVLFAYDIEYSRYIFFGLRIILQMTCLTEGMFYERTCLTGRHVLWEKMSYWSRRTYFTGGHLMEGYILQEHTSY